METVVQTVKLPLQTSNQKNHKIKQTISHYNDFLQYLSNLLPSYNHKDISTMNMSLYRNMKEEFSGIFDNNECKVSVMQEAIEDIVASYESSKSNNRFSKEYEFNNVNYFRVKASDISKVVKNKNHYALKVGFIPYNPLWFSVKGNPFVEKYLAKIVNGNAQFGTCEFRFDGEQLYAHLVIKWDVKVVDEEQVKDRVLGVDLGEKNIYTSAFLDSDGFSNIHIESGNEFRHHREKLKNRKDRFQEKGDLQAVHEISGEHERYTEQVLDTCSRQIIKQAVEHRPCMIALEDLTHYRETAPRAIHDWPFALIQEKIAYKAKAEGVPVEFVDPRNTSKMCRNCSHVSRSNRNGDDFKCTECGYEVHADVNGAMNIAFRASQFEREEFEVEKSLPTSLFEY